MAAAKTPSKNVRLLGHDKIAVAIDHYSNGSISFTADDLKTPNAEKMRSIYTLFASIIFEVQTEELVLPRMDDFAAVAYPDILEDSMSLMTTALNLQYLFSRCFDIPDFTVKDIIAPGAKRTHRLLTMLINFVCYIENSMEVRVAAMEKAAHMQQEMEIYARQGEEARAKIAEIRQRRILEQNAVEEMVPELDELTARCNELQMQERHDSKELEKNQDDVDRLELLMEVDQNLRMIKKMQGEIKERLELLKDFSEKEKVTVEFVENAHIVTSLIKDISLCLEKVRNVQAELEIFRDKILSKEHENRNAAAQIQNQERQLTAKMDRMSRIVVQNKKKVACLNEKIDELKRQRVGLEKLREEEIKILQEINSQKQTVEEELNACSKEHNQKMETMRMAYQRILKQLDVYHTSLADSWMKVAPFYGLEVQM